MNESLARARIAALPRVDAELAVFAAATVAAWVHTVDEMRIGEFVAVPFGVANAAVVGGWRRLGAALRGWITVAFGLLWALAVIPYHVLPLLGGQVTGQNISGLSRLLAGTVMIGLGVAILRRRGR
jgi:hypothetical protein